MIRNRKINMIMYVIVIYLIYFSFSSFQRLIEAHLNNFFLIFLLFQEPIPFLDMPITSQMPTMESISKNRKESESDEMIIETKESDEEKEEKERRRKERREKREREIKLKKETLEKQRKEEEERRLQGMKEKEKKEKKKKKDSDTDNFAVPTTTNILASKSNIFPSKKNNTNRYFSNYLVTTPQKRISIKRADEGNLYMRSAEKKSMLSLLICL